MLDYIHKKDAWPRKKALPQMIRRMNSNETNRTQIRVTSARPQLWRVTLTTLRLNIFGREIDASGK